MVLNILAANESDTACPRVTTREVTLAVGKLNNKKAPDYDGLMAEHLKISGQQHLILADLILTICAQKNRES